jgi:kynureninase
MRGPAKPRKIAIVCLGRKPIFCLALLDSLPRARRSIAQRLALRRAVRTRSALPASARRRTMPPRFLRQAISMTLANFTQRARQLDDDDELSPFREQFFIPRGKIYLDGNSLGLMSRPAEQAILQAMDDWKQLAVEGWTAARPPWFHLAEELAGLVAPLIGAQPHEVIVTNSTTVNLHQLLCTLLGSSAAASGARSRSAHKILSDELAFPSDTYAIKSHLALRGLDQATALVRVRSRDGATLEEDDILSAMTDDIQAVVLPGVVYTSGQWLDIARITRAARERGIIIGWDLSHSIGSVPHAMDECGADFAFWCSYKHLNGGPGASGGLYLHRRHFGCAPGLAGWFGSNKRRQFEMSPDFSPADGAGAMQIGSPNILSMAALLGSLPLLRQAGLSRIRAKSLRLTGFLMEMIDAQLAQRGFAVVTPRQEHRRGGHVAITHPRAAGICRALRRAGVIPDYRPPDIVRLAPIAMYNTFADCVLAVETIARIADAPIDASSTDELDDAADLVT